VGNDSQLVLRQHVAHGLGELLDVPVGVDVGGRLNRRMAEQLLDSLEIPRLVEDALTGCVSLVIPTLDAATSGLTTPPGSAPQSQSPYQGTKKFKPPATCRTCGESTYPVNGRVRCPPHAAVAQDEVAAATVVFRVDRGIEIGSLTLEDDSPTGPTPGRQIHAHDESRLTRTRKGCPPRSAPRPNEPKL
jgi:hypothetical protein